MPIMAVLSLSPLAALSAETSVPARPELTAISSPAREAARQSSQEPAPEQVLQAIAAFRAVTARAGLRSGQGEDGSLPHSAARRASSWHGRIFEYLRNNALDAVPHEVVQRGGRRNILRRNQFGFTVSGPVTIPKLYDGQGKSFFTVSYEGTRERVGRSYLLTLPTSQQRLGDFSDLVDRAGKPLTLYDPESTRRHPLYDPAQKVSTSNLEYERDAFPNNRIPDAQMDRVARRILKPYPQPNTDVGPFLRNNHWSNPSERNTPDGFLARIDHSLGKRQTITANVNYSDGFQDTPDIYPTAGNPGRPDRGFTNRGIEVRDTVNLTPNATYLGSFEADLSIVDTITPLDARNLPDEMGLRGVNGGVFPTLRFRGYTGMGSSSKSFLRNAMATYNFENELTLRDGRHTWTVTSRTRLLYWNTLELDSPSGHYSFNDRISGLPGIINTGDSFATFLLGQAHRAEATDQPQPAYIRRKSFQNSIADQWQISPNLTLTLRVNVDTTTPRTEEFDRQSTFDPQALNPATGTPGALVFAGYNGLGRAFQPVRVRAEPRVGVSWSPTTDRSTVVRGTILRSYSPIALRTGPFGTQGFSRRRSPVSPNRQLRPAVVLEDGFPAARNPLPDLRGDAANDSDVDMIPRTSAQPTYNHASLEVERRFPKGLILRAIGRTTQGRNLLVGGQILGLNRAPVDVLVFRDRLNDEVFRRSLRPFPHVQQVRVNYQYPGGKYRFREGRVNLQKRTGNGLSLDLEYAYRKRWDDFSGPGIQNPHDRSTAWALSRGLRPQRFSLSYTYEIPIGPGKAAAYQPGLLNKLLADWSVSGFTSWYSGDPIVLEPLFNNTGGVIPSLRVDSVAGVDPHVENPGPEGWFNPRAFVDPADFSLGNVPRTHPTLSNPAFRNHDISVTKRIALSQQRSFEVLLQGFNFLNQANWNDPDPEIGPAHARNANAGRIIGSRGGRVLQLGLRYSF